MELDMFKGSIDILMLCILKNQDSYGYEISNIIKEGSKCIYEIGEGTLYTALNRLEKKLLIDSYWRIENNRNRKYYTITDTGLVHLQERIKNIKNLNLLIEKLYMNIRD